MIHDLQPDLTSPDNSAGKIYLDGTYLDKTGGTWHSEDGPFKAARVLELLRRHPEIQARSICDIGCGSGAVLAGLEAALPAGISFTGYELSPQAYELSLTRTTNRCRFFNRDPLDDYDHFDIALVLDVVEHVEDCFAFMRRVKTKADRIIYHIPLDAHVSAILRGATAWDECGHIHLFTIETALKSVAHAGHRIDDWMLTAGALHLHPSPAARVANLVRRPLGKISPALAARVLGGYSLLILAR